MPGARLWGLSPEHLSQVAGSLGAVDLLAASCACRALRAAAGGDGVWRALLVRHLQPVLVAFFGGVPPPPAAGRSWKVHFFEFRVAWKRLVQERTGRLLIQVGAQLPCGRGPNESLSLWALLESAEKPQTYGVYDVTSFADDHPGSDLVLRSAAGLVDATGTFESAAHSDAALRRLASLAVPGLEALPYDYELEKMRWRQLSAWQSPDFQVYARASVGVASWAATIRPSPRSAGRGPARVLLPAGLCGHRRLRGAVAVVAGGPAAGRWQGAAGVRGDLGEAVIFTRALVHGWRRSVAVAVSAELFAFRVLALAVPRRLVAPRGLGARSWVV
ncbi:unnamed protein product [Prorocentrum cordatum]|uniref:Cytochrome b5 heme-binding domain-containing protein n=1 Tax=Prorocentrum cordatum TaxID=2364126 RepID=A0ABN9XU73_9DINO|nr:unnamed protein product [Polarella glacialis]